MVKKLLALIALGMMLSGCFMAPLALLGPATSGFSTTSIIQSSFTTTASLVIKKSTGKSITEHAFSAINKDVLQQTYFPENAAECLEWRTGCRAAGLSAKRDRLGEEQNLCPGESCT